jgi:STE24 endopeptidase
MHAFTLAFLAALVITMAMRLWLSLRHLRHVLRNRDRVPPEFAGRITLASHQKAADYTDAKVRLGMIETVVGVLVLLAFTLGGGLQWLSDAWSGAFAQGGYAHGIALVVSAVAIGSILDLPFSIYRTFVVEAKFGFNRMTASLYLADLAKQTALGAALGIPVLGAVLWLMDRMGEWWWLYVWLFWMSFNLLVLTLYPTVIAPLFNKFSPLDDASLKSRIEGLLAKCGFTSSGLFVMDSSKRSSHGNAYFTGFGAAKRIVLFDTLITRLAPSEVEAVLAHELGHFKHRHVAKRMVLLFTASLAFLWLLGYLIGKDWFFLGLGVHTQGTAMALMLFFMVLPVFTFLLQPVASLYSRMHEYQADAYAARQSSPEDLVQALVKLYQDNASTLTPDPLHSAVYDSHPPAALRIARLQGLRQAT